MKILSEHNDFLLANDFETAWLRDKSTGMVVFEEEFYGDACCGLIGEDGNWAAVGGDHLAIWANGSMHVIANPDIRWVVAMRQVSAHTIEVLTDPWSEGSAIWGVNIDSMDVKKVRDFPDYSRKEYTEDLAW